MKANRVECLIMVNHISSNMSLPKNMAYMDILILK